MTLKSCLTTGCALAAVACNALLSGAHAHPHDLLAQCQLPSGKWVMCDETIHASSGGGHVPKASIHRPGGFKAFKSGTRTNSKFRLRSRRLRR